VRDSRTPTTSTCGSTGFNLKVRLEQEKLWLLVMIGVRSDGRKELVALTDGYRESPESWPICCGLADDAG
jgi:hypothetical protein